MANKRKLRAQGVNEGEKRRGYFSIKWFKKKIKNQEKIDKIVGK